MNTERDPVIAALREHVAEAVATASTLTPAQSALITAAEGWPVPVVLYHIGLGLRRQAGWLARAPAMDAPYAFEWEPTHEMNAIIVREHAALGMEEAARGIEDGWARMRLVIANLGDTDWERTVFVFNGRPRSATVVLTRIVLPHVSGHLESVRRTLAAPVAVS